MLSGVGTEFTLLGEEHKGLYVEDEDNVGSVRKLGSQYNDDENVYTRSGGVTCYETSPVNLNVGGSTSFSTIYVLSNGIYTKYTGDWRNCTEKTYYTRSNGAFRYTTNKVDEPLYKDGGTHTYTMYKQYSGKVYDAGKAAVIVPAEVTTQSVIALTV